MVERVAILGAGSFGTAMAATCARSGNEVRLWGRNSESARDMQHTRRNRRYLPDFLLEDGIEVTSNLEYALEGAIYAILAVPSQKLREMLQRPEFANTELPLVLACKGIENDTLMTMAEVVLDVLGRASESRVFALSGPSFAKEMMAGYPTAVVLAGSNQSMVAELTGKLSSETFRVYGSPDVVGVEMGGAVKNVMAIAAGAVAGLGLGDNTRAALVTRGLAETTRLAVAKGAQPMTLAGLSGVGDMMLTCTGSLSRNRSVGEKLAQGMTLDEALDAIQQVAEGVRTTASVYSLARKLNVEVPITDAVHSVLYEHVPVSDALHKLTQRPLRAELEYMT